MVAKLSQTVVPSRLVGLKRMNRNTGLMLVKEEFEIISP